MFDPTRRKALEALLTALSLAVVKPQGLLQPESWQPLLSSETNLANWPLLALLQSLLDHSRPTLLW
jgi:hypothetical protein